MSYMMREKTNATKALDDFTKNRARKLALEMILQSSRTLTATQKQDLQQELTAINSDLDSSIVAPLVGGFDASRQNEEYLFTAIVEDLDVDTAFDKFGSAKRISDMLEQKIGRQMLTDPLRKAWGYIYLTKDNPVYQFLMKTTQYSDFVARYAIYKHLTEKQKKTHEEAIETVLTQFIYYDAPSSPELQYLNDHGFAAFTKYAIRIQKPMLKLMQNKPGNALSLFTLEGLLGIDIPDPTDSLSIVPGYDQLTNPYTFFTGNANLLWGPNLIGENLDAIDAIIP